MVLKKIQVCTNLSDPTNCYIIFDEKSKEAMVIDPGAEPEKIEEMLDILHANVKYIYITHCHGDHIGALKEIKEKTCAKILTHRLESKNFTNVEVNLTDYIGIPNNEVEADARVDDGDLLHIGDIEFIVIHTPGHTKGGSSLYCPKEKMLFSGDTLFRGTWGRTDLPTGGIEDIMDSIMNKLLKLPEDTIVYPGHGRLTMISQEIPIYYELKPRKA